MKWICLFCFEHLLILVDTCKVNKNKTKQNLLFWFFLLFIFIAQTNLMGISQLLLRLQEEVVVVGGGGYVEAKLLF